jgi:hypothetical protein
MKGRLQKVIDGKSTGYDKEVAWALAKLLNINPGKLQSLGEIVEFLNECPSATISKNEIQKYAERNYNLVASVQTVASKTKLQVAPAQVSCDLEPELSSTSTSSAASVSSSNPKPLQGARDYLLTEAEFNRLWAKNQFPKNPFKAEIKDFFTNRNFKFDPESKNYYDMSIEDSFGVMWLEPTINPKDKKFIEALNAEFSPEIKEIEKKYKNATKPFSVTESTRLANSDTFPLFHMAKDDPRKMAFMRKVLAYCINR